MPTGEDNDIYARIVDKLDQNGALKDAEWRTLVLLALVDLGQGMRKLKEMGVKVDNLERNSILLIARKHPKVVLPVAIFTVIITVSVVLHLGLGAWLMDLLGIPALP